MLMLDQDKEKKIYDVPKLKRILKIALYWFRLVYCHIHQGEMKLLVHITHRINGKQGKENAKINAMSAKQQNSAKN